METNQNKAWLDLDKDEILASCEDMGVAKFRAKQISQWLMKGATIDEMRTLPADLREKMKTRVLGLPSLLQEQISSLDGTRKYLYGYEDGQTVEAVLMQYAHGNTLCISSQVGCRMGCRFCASTIGGLERNLTAGEMLGEVLFAERKEQMEGRAPSDGRAIHNIVMMGCGEPLDNYDNVISFLQRLNSPDGLEMSLRNVSLSTCGLPDGIRKLAVDAPGINLAISLHATTDEQRIEMMPIAQRYSLAEIMEAARDFVKVTGRRVHFEYAMVRGVNDTEEDANRLARLLRGFQCHVNLIPLNPVRERDMRSTERSVAHAFAQTLTDMGISATVRRELGADIDGACGQLRARAQNTLASEA